MENASKALIMAGSVLIALMIIGALLLMFNNLSTYQGSDTQTTREAQVIEFNNQYETYNRKNVRGSDLYSLLNRVVDYNRRKSTKGTGDKDEGQYLAYMPMTIEFDLKPGGGKQAFYASNSSEHLIMSDSYTVNDISNTFEKDIYKDVKDLEDKYGADSLNNLVIAESKIFIEDRSSDTEKEKAVKNFNSVCKSGNISNFNAIKENSQIRKEVYKYYEYVQFKRAKFNSVKVEYDDKTGRIVYMKFEFTGKFE